MIKKLDLERRNSFGTLDWLEKWNEPSGAKLIEEKINELVDAVNVLQKHEEPEKCATGTTADKLLDPTPSMLEEVLENIKKEEERKALEALTPDLQDPYAI